MDNISQTSPLHKKNLFIVLLLQFASGLPLALSGSTFQAWLTKTNISIATIGAMSLIGLPYVYKFLWAPLFDYFPPPLMGRRRGWLIIIQAFLFLTILSFCFLNPAQHLFLMVAFAFCLAFFSASQDIVIDAYRTDLLDAKERGLGAAFTTGAYRLAMMLTGGIALILADRIGWHWTYFLMALTFLIGILGTIFGEEPPFNQTEKKIRSFKNIIIEPLQEILKRPQVISLLAFILLYKLGDAMSLSLATPFLMRGIGFSLTVVGATFKIFGVIATIVGALMGGVLMVRLSLFRALFYFGILQIVAIFSLLILAIVGKNYLCLVMVIFLDSFCNGLGTTALLAFLMSLCDHRFTAAQFALLSAFASMGRVFIGPIAGIMLEHISWTSFFIICMFISTPALILLWRIRSMIK